MGAVGGTTGSCPDAEQMSCQVRSNQVALQLHLDMTYMEPKTLHCQAKVTDDAGPA